MDPRLHNGSDRITAADALSLTVIFLLAVLVAFFRRQLGADAVWLLGTFVSLSLFILLAVVMSGRRSIWRIVHAFSPALILPVLFNTLGPLIDCTNPARWDAEFARLDARLFGDLAALWRGVLGRPAWLTDLGYLAYVSYYLTPVVLAVLLYRRELQDDFRQMVFTVVVTFYVSYVGYFMFPTLGPRVPAHSEAWLIGGGAISAAVRLFIETAERTRTDAFPSGHVAIAVVCLAFAWRTSTAAFVAFAPVVGAIIFSTVYLHYHYVVDVLAGLGLAGVCMWAGPRLEPVVEPAAVVRRFGLRLGLW
ncbi:MAG: phosphatase PAP2 family protein [Candidatus Binatia bacterium]